MLPWLQCKPSENSFERVGFQKANFKLEEKESY